jgi:hypothetical protein
MQLGDFLQNAGSDNPAPSKTVTFKIVNSNPSTGELRQIEVTASLVFVAEHKRQEALRNALLETRKSFPDGNIPAARLSDEETYQILALALRDSDDPRKFFSSVQQLKACLVRPVAEELISIYDAFMSAEFPAWIDKEQFEKLVQDAQSKSLADLLLSTDSLTVLRALPGLAYHFAK